MKFATIIALLAVTLFGQNKNTSFVLLPQQDGVTTGTFDFREAYSYGQNFLRVRPPANIPANFGVTLMSELPTGNGYCIGISPSGALSNQKCSASKAASAYNWSQVISSVSAGTRTITMDPCRVTAADTAWAFRIYDGLASEVVFPTGVGTCVAGSGLPGTVQVTLASSYTTPTIASASKGIQEAIYSVSVGQSVTVFVEDGDYNIYSSILTSTRYTSIVCESDGAVFFPRENNISVFSSTSPGGIKVSNCALNNAYSKTGTKGVYTYNPIGNSFGTTLDNLTITGFEIGIHLGTAYAVSLTRNKIVNASSTALWIEQVETGDAGIGLISGNTFSDSVGAAYGVLWNGPGNLKLQGNSFNGYIEQIHLEETMGRVNVSGTTVTWVSGNKFRTIWESGYSLVASSTVAGLISDVVDDQTITLSTPQPSCTNCRYYVGNTGQMQIMNNTMDSGVSTLYGIRAVGDIPFYNFQLNGNFFSNPVQTGYTGISIEGVGWYFGSVKHNNLQTSVTGTTTAIYISAGSYIDVMNNQIASHQTGVNIGASAIGIKTEGNDCVNLVNTVNCILSASATSVLREITPVTFAQLSSLTAASGSMMYCSDCKPSPTSTACMSGGGAFVTFTQAIKVCQNAVNPGPNFVFGGNSFGTPAIIGTNDNFGIAVKVNNVTQWTVQTDGSWWTSSDGGPSIGANGSNRPLHGYFAGLLQSKNHGTSGNCTDATASPADCSASSAGSVIVSAGTTSTVVNTTTVSANSQIFVQFDSSLGAKLGVTCNTTVTTAVISARSAGTSFTIATSAAPVTNPACFSYFIVN